MIAPGAVLRAPSDSPAHPRQPGFLSPPQVAKVETTAAPLAEEASPKTLPSPDKSPKRLVSNIGEASAPVTPRKGGHARQVSFRLVSSSL